MLRDIEYKIATGLVVILAIIVVFLGQALVAPRPPAEFETQHALDMYAFENGLCPAYSEINLYINGTWACTPK